MQSISSAARPTISTSLHVHMQQMQQRRVVQTNNHARVSMSQYIFVIPLGIIWKKQDPLFRKGISLLVRKVGDLTFLSRLTNASADLGPLYMTSTRLQPSSFLVLPISLSDWYSTIQNAELCRNTPIRHQRVRTYRHCQSNHAYPWLYVFSPVPLCECDVPIYKPTHILRGWKESDQCHQLRNGIRS